MSQIISTSGYSHREPGIFHIKSHEFKNKDGISNLICYITRTRINEDRQDELICYGLPSGCPCIRRPEEIIAEFEYISKSYYTKGSKAVHYVIQISDYVFASMGNSMDQLKLCMVECAQYIFEVAGHQCCFAIHHSADLKLHVHFAINATNYRTGKKLNQYPVALKKTIEYPVKNIIMKYMHYNFEDVFSNFS